MKAAALGNYSTYAYRQQYILSLTLCTLNPSYPPALSPIYNMKINNALSFWSTRAPQSLQPAIEVFGLWPLLGGTAIALQDDFPTLSSSVRISHSTTSMHVRGLSITEQRRGLGPGVPFQTVNLGRALTASIKYVPKLSPDVFCYESVCHVPKA